MTEQVVRCQKCGLVQYFKTPNCRKCHKRITLPKEPEPLMIAQPVKQLTLIEQIARRVFFLRRKKDMSQRELGELIGGPRTYISKIEQERILPHPAQIEKIAKAFGVAMGDFLCTEAEFRERDLLSDPFILELAKAAQGIESFHWVLLLQETERLATKKVRMVQ